MDNSTSKLERVLALKQGKGIKYLLDEAYVIFGNPFLTHDLDYKVIAYTENRVTDDTLWNELCYGGSHGEETIRFFSDESFIDIVASTKSIALLTSVNMKYDRLLGKLYNKDNIVVGAVDIVACYKPLEEDDPEAFEALRKALCKEIAKCPYYQAYGEAYQEQLICKLVDSNIEDKRFYPAHVEIVYYGLKSNLYLAVVDISHIDPEHARLAYYRDLLKRTQPGYKYAVYANYILIIISTDDPAIDVKRDLNRLNRMFHKNNIYAGISKSFENLFELPRHYQEAVSALSKGFEIASQRIFLYEEFK